MDQLVMVIDDSLVIRKILEICLHRAGYEVKSFPDGVEALRWFATLRGEAFLSFLRQPMSVENDARASRRMGSLYEHIREPE